ncbi:NUDIX hydrolase [Salinifilum ghardaiensis]
MAGAVVRDPVGRLFVQRRAAHRHLFPNCWDIVGGAIEPGEDARGALQREIREETGWHLRSVIRQVCDETWTFGDTTHREVVFLVEVDGDLSRPELETGKVVEHRWIDGPQDARVLEENRKHGGTDFVGRVVERCLEKGVAT